MGFLSTSQGRAGLVESAHADFKKMMPLMMMGMAMGQGSNVSSKRMNAEGTELQRKMREMQMKQEKLLEELITAKTQSDHINSMSNPVLARLEALDKKLELMRQNKLKQKEKPGMPKFLMYMQQNLMSQAMMQAHLNDTEQGVEQFPKIIPVAVDPRKRIMPFSTNPYINFEMNKPASKNNNLVEIVHSRISTLS